MKKHFVEDGTSFSSISSPRLFPNRTSLRVQEVAKALQVDLKTVVGWIESGDLAAVNTGNASQSYWRIPVSAYDVFLKKRKSV